MNSISGKIPQWIFDYERIGNMELRDVPGNKHPEDRVTLARFHLGRDRWTEWVALDIPGICENIKRWHDNEERIYKRSKGFEGGGKLLRAIPAYVETGYTEDWYDKFMRRSRL